MSQVQQVNVGGATYNVAQASAEKQKRLLLLIGANIAYTSNASGTVEINEPFLLGSLLRLPEATFDEVAGIVLAQTIKSGGDSVVNIGDFQGNMVNYIKLVAAAIKVNLQDFFTYLDKANAERDVTPNQTVKK